MQPRKDSLSVSINKTNTPTFNTHRRKFLEEANRLKALSRPNIVKVSDVIEANGTAYFVMNYIEGNPLSRKKKADFRSRSFAHNQPHS